MAVWARCWKRIDTQGNTLTVEAYDHNLDIKGAIEITEQEFNAYIASLPPSPDAAVHFVSGTPGESAAKRIDHIEKFLKQLYP